MVGQDTTGHTDDAVCIFAASVAMVSGLAAGEAAEKHFYKSDDCSPTQDEKSCNIYTGIMMAGAIGGSAVATPTAPLVSAAGVTIVAGTALLTTERMLRKSRTGMASIRGS